MVDQKVAFRERGALPRLGEAALSGPILLDTNVIINALAGRGPVELKGLLANLPFSLISAVTAAELSWAHGRLDPDHPQTKRVLAAIDGALGQIAPAKILAPSTAQWTQAGTLGGRAARAVAGTTRSLKTADERIELLNDAITAIVAAEAGATIVTQDRDFDILMQLEPGVDVLFYDQPM